MKKIIINESQLKLIESLILENKIQKILSSVEKNDILMIYREGSDKPIKFEVVNKLPDGIFVRVADKNSDDREKLIQFNISNLEGNTLTLNFTKRPEGGDNSNKINWNKMTIKGVTGISLLDEAKNPKGTAKVIDNEESDEEENVEDNSEELDNEINQRIEQELNELKVKLNNLKIGNDYIFILDDDSKLYFTVINKENNDVSIKLTKGGSEEAGKFKKIIGDTFEFNPHYDIKLSDDKKTINIEIGNSDYENSIIIDNVVNVQNDYDDPSNDKSTLTDREALELVLKDSRIRNAFMKQPTLWDLITNKEPKGIDQAKRILNKVFDRESNNSKEDVNDILKVNRTIQFEIRGNNFSKSTESGRYYLVADSKYNAKIRSKEERGVNASVNKIVGNSNLMPDMLIYSIEDKNAGLYRAEIITEIGTENETSEKRTIKIFKQF